MAPRNLDLGSVRGEWLLLRPGHFPDSPPTPENGPDKEAGLAVVVKIKIFAPSGNRTQVFEK
jgi:hypothetical protein